MDNKDYFYKKVSLLFNTLRYSLGHITWYSVKWEIILRGEKCIGTRTI